MINEYLCDKFPPGGDAYDATPLLPADPAARAKARIIMQRSNDLSTSFYTYLSNKDEVSFLPLPLPDSNIVRSCGAGRENISLPMIGKLEHVSGELCPLGVTFSRAIFATSSDESDKFPQPLVSSRSCITVALGTDNREDRFRMPVDLLPFSESLPVTITFCEHSWKTEASDLFARLTARCIMTGGRSFQAPEI